MEMMGKKLMNLGVKKPRLHSFVVKGMGREDGSLTVCAKRRTSECLVLSSSKPPHISSMLRSALHHWLHISTTKPKLTVISQVHIFVTVKSLNF